MAFSETQTVTPYRHLRITTIATFIPAFALLVPTGVVTERPLPAIGLVPMAISAMLSAATLMSKRKEFPETPYADAAVVLALLVVMIPSYVSERKPGAPLLSLPFVASR